MTATIEIPDLWGSDLRTDVLSPLTILKAQAEKLNLRMGGLLVARTYSDTDVVGTRADGVEEAAEFHRLELHAPAINYTEEVLVVTHNCDRPYPVTVEGSEALPWPDGSLRERVTCHNEAEYLAALRVALQSRSMRSAIDSIVAMSNERNRAPLTPPGT